MVALLVPDSCNKIWIALCAVKTAFKSNFA